MPSRVANCPNCGGQVEFKAGNSLLAVCPYCASAVARLGDDVGELEILGKVAPVTDLGSPLSIGTPGRYQKKGFRLVGQIQLDYGAGPWNEWYAAFDDGTWGWIAEAQGRAYITFGKDLPGLPDFERASVGARFSVGDHPLVVVERRSAEFKAAQGELPFAVAPGSRFNYADVQGPNGLFGTLDYGTGHTAEALFLGEELPYEALFDAATLRDVEPGQAASAAGLNCPNCGSGVELRAPDDAMRVTCGTCGSLLDCAKGNELYLLSSAKRSGPEPQIPLGSVGRVDGIKWTIFGHLHRSVTYDGSVYGWEEYLLHGGVKEGYRWLICSDGHWTWVDPVHTGSVSPAGARGAKYDGETYRHFQGSSARVEALRGEFYWKVAVGERVATQDYIRPPFVLSREMAADEVNWSLGRYLEPSEVEAAFSLKDSLPKPVGVAPHQPNPHAGPLKGMLAFGGAFSLLLLLLALAMNFTSDNAVQLTQKWPLAQPKDVVAQAKNRRIVGAQLQSDQFELSGRSNVALRLTADVKDTWLFFDGELVDLTTNRTTPFGMLVSYQSKYAGGSSWGQGGKTRVVFLGDLPGGSYLVRGKPQWAATGKPPTRMSLEVREDVFIGSHAVTVFFLLWLLPLFKAVQYYSFEKRRWAESDHAG